MRTLLLILIGFVAISAVVTGLLMISYPDGLLLGIPRSMIENSPFPDLLIPGIILTGFIGGLNFMALYHFMDRRRTSVYNWTTVAGVATCGWVAVQFIMIHSVLWFQSIYLVAGIATVLLSLELKNKWLA
ncbi:MAG TPA: hypothetical protein VF145_09805 [Chitinophagaceae bacterium]